MKIAIIGTRGIPNHYGGFEQFAEYLSLGLVERGHEITVYNSDKHPYQEKSWNGVEIIHCYDPEDKLGTVGQFIYDFNCILDTRKKNFDIILQLGYTSSSVWGWMLPRKKSIVTTNMDGLEWMRSKFSPKVREFLKYAERLGTKYSDYLISDSIGIQAHLQKTYQKNSLFIPYGAHLFLNPNEEFLADYGVSPYYYNMLVARLEPENSIEVILDGVLSSNDQKPFLVIGKHQTTFGDYLKSKFSDDNRIKFIGGVYNIEVLNNLRYFSNLYFHGHTVGGTNPSLLEAMASQSLIVANRNIFNESILGSDAYYFENFKDISIILDRNNKEGGLDKIKNNEEKIRNCYSWPIIINQYEAHFLDILKASKLC
ncbi:MAG: glycosyltransferase family 1 protein [Pedobacter sp.]|nr:MAG: glycosyltransferase family 1 protein [Pedobacter sp.]